MNANRFHSRLLAELGVNLRSKATFKETTISLLKNSFITFHLIFVALLPSIHYFIIHFHETIEMAMSSFQLPCFGICSLAYINFCFHKTIVNEIFVDIETILIKRKKYIESEER